MGHRWRPPSQPEAWPSAQPTKRRRPRVRGQECSPGYGREGHQVTLRGTKVPRAQIRSGAPGHDPRPNGLNQSRLSGRHRAGPETPRQIPRSAGCAEVVSAVPKVTAATSRQPSRPPRRNDGHDQASSPPPPPPEWLGRAPARTSPSQFPHSATAESSCEGIDGGGTHRRLSAAGPGRRRDGAWKRLCGAVAGTKRG
jgi:hypothetical protein